MSVFHQTQLNIYHPQWCLPLLALTLMVIISSPDSLLFKLCAFSGQPDRLEGEHKQDTMRLSSDTSYFSHNHGLMSHHSSIDPPIRLCTYFIDQ